MGKRKVLALIAGAAFVVFTIVTAPLVLMAIDTVTDDTPDEAEVCAHLNDDLGLGVPDCDTWLAGSETVFGDYYPRRLNCMSAAQNLDEARLCDDMAHLGVHWDESHSR